MKEETLLKIEQILLENSEERTQLIDEIYKTFSSKAINIKKVGELIKLSRSVVRVKLRLQTNIGKLSDIKEKEGDFADQLMITFTEEFGLIQEFQKEFFEKVDNLSGVTTVWVATNLQIDKLISLADRLLMDKAKEKDILRLISSKLYKERAG